MIGKEILIFGAGGFGREVAWLIEDINKLELTWNISGYIDNSSEKRNQLVNGYKVLGDSSIIKNLDKIIDVTVAVGDPKARIAVVDELVNPFVKFPILIHPSVIMSKKVQIGFGTIICAGSIFTTDIKIGQHVIVNLDCTIGHDAIIDDYCTLSPSVNISGNVTIGKAAFIGTGAHLINNVSVGENTVIGAGAVVTNNIPSNCTAVGIPAKPIKFH